MSVNMGSVFLAFRLFDVKALPEQKIIYSQLFI